MPETGQPPADDDRDDPQDDDDRPQPIGWKSIAAAAVLLLLFGLILFGSVRGCATEDPQEAAKREEEKKKTPEEKEKEEKERQEDPKISDLVVLPNESSLVDQFVKPGHWAAASQQMQAKQRLYHGQTRTAVFDDKRNPLPLGPTSYLLESTRPAALAQGTTKIVESVFFVPQTELRDDAKLTLMTSFEEGGLGFAQQRIVRMESLLPHQYHFLVLAKEPTRYSLIKTLDSVQVPYAGEISSGDGMIMDDAKSLHYRVSLPDITRGVPVPDNPLMWTAIAYVLWDEVDPEPMTPEQEQALVDWLYWGGQLIVNGPDSLDLIQGSFLAPLMPATNGGPREIGAADLATFNENWMVTGKTPGTPLAPEKPWSGIKLVPTAEAEKSPLWQSTGGLLAERMIGRGRIVVSAMQLSERELVNWRSGFESWFNACLLRRPPRQYFQVAFGGASLFWDPAYDPTLSNRRLDAKLTSKLRYFTRDIGIETNYRWEDVFDNAGAGSRGMFSGRINRQSANSPTREFRAPATVGGVGAWNDFNTPATAAREALRSAAGVDVPNRAFVVACLAAYLVVLVPINWLIFYMLGRIEWAWIAAPLIAIAGTFVVVHQAQLDIGFVRSQTEIALLELQPEHARGHLARFTALYTSLSTTYEVEFDDTTALAMPFPRDAADSGTRQSLTTVDFTRQGEHVRLSGLPVLSNSTNFVHSEQMFSLDGPILVAKTAADGGWQLENHSQLDLKSVGIVRKDGNELQGVWIGELARGQSARLSSPELLPPLVGPPFVSERETENGRQTVQRLQLEPLFRLAYEAEHLEDGELRLVARVDESLAGETVTPSASQLRGGTLVVAHLAYDDPPPPARDRNTKLDMKIATDEEL